MRSEVAFNRNLIAPCGMNCGTCIAFLRDKNRCPGCRILTTEKAVSVKQCIITKCDYLKKSESGFCYECEKFPCKRMKQLEKRYSTKYGTSFIENLMMIKEKGINKFLIFESKRRSCINCGAILSVHRKHCLSCMSELN